MKQRKRPEGRFPESSAGRPDTRQDTRPVPLNRAGVHAIRRADAKWFRKRPGVTARYRRAGEREWPTLIPPTVPPGMTAELWVEVVQLEPGVRVRQPYWVVGEVAA